ncbi:hypothetical protein C8F04DRAFT_1294306 [Mycena alexandri]|uniref:DUF7779 domain-containing protein n=1 Tax=Mycena alexandri TaxID=1745969 RepID=A0AAD6SIF2_9AGAR|nr:hypothetical protein C8F04DRAFT_1294306 [Mycena alexandri]
MNLQVAAGICVLAARDLTVALQASVGLHCALSRAHVKPLNRFPGSHRLAFSPTSLSMLGFATLGSTLHPTFLSFFSLLDTSIISRSTRRATPFPLLSSPSLFPLIYALRYTNDPLAQSCTESAPHKTLFPDVARLRDTLLECSSDERTPFFTCFAPSRTPLRTRSWGPASSSSPHTRVSMQTSSASQRGGAWCTSTALQTSTSQPLRARLPSFLLHAVSRRRGGVASARRDGGSRVRLFILFYILFVLLLESGQRGGGAGEQRGGGGGGAEEPDGVVSGERREAVGDASPAPPDPSESLIASALSLDLVVDEVTACGGAGSPFDDEGPAVVMRTASAVCGCARSASYGQSAPAAASGACVARERCDAPRNEDDTRLHIYLSSVLRDRDGACAVGRVVHSTTSCVSGMSLRASCVLQVESLRFLILAVQDLDSSRCPSFQILNVLRLPHYSPLGKRNTTSVDSDLTECLVAEACVSLSSSTMSTPSPNVTPPVVGKKTPSKSKSEWLAPAILTARTITTASECAPFPYIKGVSGTVVILLETIEKVKKNREDLKELCNTTTEIITILHDQILTHGNTAAVKFKVLCEELESHLEAVILVVQNLQDQSKGFRGRVKEFLMAVVETNFKVDEIHTIITAPSFAMVTAVQTINNCPPPSRIFQGRQTILDKMHQFFNTASGRQLIYVLHGLGGAGKTQIALKYIKESSAKLVAQFKSKRVLLNPLHSFSDIFLVDASTLDTINTGLKNMAMSKSVGDSAQDALTWLQSKHGQWLLFFDNADDPGINLNKFFPLCDHGNIIITSRNPELKVYGEHYPVSDMEEADAIALLLRSATKESSEENVQIAAKIVKELYFLPLGIAQAGAFISKSEDLNGYLRLYQKNRAKLLKEKPGQSHDQYAWTVYTTWQISFDKLSPLAATLLQLCSFLHYTGISEDMFSHASQYSFPVWLPATKEELQEPLEFLSHFLGPTGEWNSLSFFDVTNEIKAYSLIIFDAATKTFSIHPLVHTWTRTTLVDERSSCLCIRSILGMSIPEIPDSDITLTSPRLMPHLGALSLFNVNVGADFRAAFGGIYFSAGKFKEAQDIIKQAFEAYKLSFGDEHLGTLEAMHRLALTSRYLGEYEKAKKLEVTVLEKRTKLLGEDHPETLIAMGDLAATHFMLGDLGKAKELEVTVLEKRTTLLDRDHPETLMAMGNLARTYFELGDFEKAKELEVLVFEKRSKLLGEDHPNTLLVMGNLARTHFQLGDFEKTKELEVVVFEKRFKLLGEGHPDTLMAMGNLARAHFKLGDFEKAMQFEDIEKAKQLEVMVLARRTKVLGEDHPSTLIAMGDLARMYSELGDFPKAKELEVTVLEKRSKLLGQDHPGNLMAMLNLATTHFKLGDFAKAKELEVTVLEKWTTLLGQDHPDTLTAMGNLARTHFELQDLAKAKELEVTMLKKRRQILGNQHPDTIRAMQNLTFTRQKLNTLREAEELEQVVKDNNKLL